MIAKPKAIIHIGGGPLQIHSINWAKELGLHVIVTDRDSSAPGIQYADDFYAVSGSDRDNLVEIARNLSKKYNVIGAYSSSDFGLLSVAAINEALGLNGCPYKIVERALNKFESKMILQENHICTPKGIHTSVIKEDYDELMGLSYPLIVKPVDSCGSQGVKSIQDRTEIGKAVELAFNYSDEVVIEEYIDGIGYDTIGIVWDGAFIPCGIGNRIFSPPPYHFPVCGFTPCDLAPEKIQEAYDVTKRAALSLGIDFSPVKADLLYLNNSFYVIEIAPRFHGDVFTSKLIHFSHQSSPIKKLFELQSGSSSKISYETNANKCVAWQALFPLSNAIDYVNVIEKVSTEFHLIDTYIKPHTSQLNRFHKDNTSLVGFLWIELESMNALAQFNEYFAETFKDMFL